MSYAKMMLPEFDREMAVTRTVLERVPEDRLDWRPHAKSNTIGWNACHIAEIVGWLGTILTTSSFDVAPPGKEPYTTPNLRSRREILELLDRNIAEGRAALEAADSVDVTEPWSLLGGGQTYFTMPRADVIREFVISHVIHHRAILTVYYRLNDVPVPPVYGPSGDEGM